ncbi:winged helix-turn-helix transcriptional regulator, partial [candidate division WWE3 bacterium]|nr:winged helix-turn-helix transcriptional regulator [candidate division WWE3 bacterium]
MLKDLFISEVRVKMLSLLLLSHEQSMHVRDIVRKVGTEINAVRRELDRLTKVGLLKRRPKGNKVYYDVNKGFVYYPEILSLVAKENGLGHEILKNLKDLGRISFAVMSKALVKGRVAGPLDVDLLIIGSVDAVRLKEIITKSEQDHQHEINYTVMGEDEFLFRKRRREPFIVQLLSQSRVMLVGDE